MKKIIYSGIGVHMIVQLISSFLLVLLTSITNSSLIYFVELIVVMALYLFILNKFSSKIDLKNIIRDVRFILLTNIFLLTSGFLLFQFASGKIATLGQVLIITGVYFNYGFSPVLAFKLPAIVGFIVMALASPTLLYSGYIMSKK